MKHITLIALILGMMGFFTEAQAKIVPGYYKGELRYTKLGAKREAKKEVSIFVSLPEAGGNDSAYGLIITGKEGKGRAINSSLYRIEELVDGTQVWVNLYQGQKKVLKSPSTAEAEFTAKWVDRGRHNRLILKPTETRSNCIERDIEVTLTSGKSWSALPSKSQRYKQPDGRTADYTVDTLEADLELGGVVNSGSFRVGRILNNLATLRKSVLSQESLSGWAQQREIFAMAFSIHSGRSNDLYVMKLPVGQKFCHYQTVRLKKH